MGFAVNPVHLIVGACAENLLQAHLFGRLPQVVSNFVDEVERAITRSVDS
jgi:hypothetical protein